MNEDTTNKKQPGTEPQKVTLRPGDNKSDSAAKPANAEASVAQDTKPAVAQRGQNQSGPARKPAGPRSNGSSRSGGGNRSGGGPRRPRPNRARTIIPEVGAVPINNSVYNGASEATKPAAKPAPAIAGEARQANAVVREDKLRVIPLGGLGEIGKNMTAFEYANDIIVVDMGFAFPEDLEPGVDYIIPDVTYLEKKKQNIRGVIITHGHEDHIGGTPYVLPKIGNVPVYGAAFSLAMVEKKLGEHKMNPDFRVIDPDKHERIQLGQFTVELVRVTHAIPDATAVYIETPVASVFHTGDFRFDVSPADGKQVDVTRIKEIGAKGVTLLMSDSTSCESVGHSPSESTLEPSLLDLFGRAKGRVIISSFSSQLNRVQLIVNAAHQTGRKLAVTGRSMLTNIEIAVRMGYLKFPPGIIVRMQDVNHLKDSELVVLSTGSQGEVNSALVRMSTGDHQQIKIKPGDTIIMSSSVIPGNELDVVRSIDNLMREGSQVYHNMWRAVDECGLLHVGGHAWREELVEMYQLVKPKYFMPIHGEFHMQIHHAELLEKEGLVRDNIFVLDNGDVLELSAKGAMKGERVQAGPVMVDGSGVGDVNNTVLLDRLSMRDEGIFVVVATVDRKTGKLLSSPDIISRGFVYMKDNEELINQARAVVRRAFEQRTPGRPTDWSKFKMDLRDAVSDLLYKQTRRNPMVLPVVNEV